MDKIEFIEMENKLIPFCEKFLNNNKIKSGVYELKNKIILTQSRKELILLQLT